MSTDDDQGGSTVRGVPGHPARSTPADQGSVAARLQDVDDALEQLAGLPVDAQVAVFTTLHQQLTAALAVTPGGPPDEPPGHRPGSARPSR